MTNLIIQEIEKKFIKKKVPILRPGYAVRVHQKIKEGNKERIQVFEGMVISTNAGHGSSKTFKVRKVVQGIGVEKIFPLYSPQIAKIEVTKTFKVRRAKLNHLRDSVGMSKRLSAKLGLTDKDQAHKEKKGLAGEDEEEIVEEKVAKEGDKVETEVETPKAEAPEGDEKPKKAEKAEEPTDEPKEEEKKEE